MDLYEFDRQQTGGIFCGVDEAGRGPLAGDVYAAAVILPPGCELPGLNDSKKLSEKKREILFDLICEKAVAWSVGTASVEEIDHLNILQATFLAMKRAVEGLSVLPRLALVDGSQNPPLPVHSRAIVKGDGKSASIAAASILAKVSRDRYMKRLAEQYPQYRFEQHKGYPTPLHYRLLDEFGPSPVHRKSFLKKYQAGIPGKAAVRGKLGEDTIAGLLEREGYRLLERNYSCAWGELDILAEKDGITAVVEVKTRKFGAATSGREAVSRSKQEKIAKAALCWLSEQGSVRQLRFDVAEVTTTDRKKPSVVNVSYYENAFESPLEGVYL